MKKTVTVNLDKTIFNIDDDAYTVLESYLEALHDLSLIHISEPTRPY